MIEKVITMGRSNKYFFCSSIIWSTTRSFFSSIIIKSFVCNFISCIKFFSNCFTYLFIAVVTSSTDIADIIPWTSSRTQHSTCHCVSRGIFCNFWVFDTFNIYYIFFFYWLTISTPICDVVCFYIFRNRLSIYWNYQNNLH